MAEKISYISEKEYDKEVLQGGLVVLDFYSTDCPPCEALASKFESLSAIYGDDIKFIKIFRQENRDLAESLDVRSSPTLIFYKNGEIVGDRFSGGIRRSDIVANLDKLLTEERVAELKQKIKPVTTQCDLLILGAGPAGLTAGIYAGQAKLDTIIVDTGAPGGQVKTTHLVSNYPGFVKPVEGFMLTHFMGEQAAAAGVKTRFSVDVTQVDLEKKSILVDDYETIEAKKIIIASGSSYKPLGVPGEKEFKGHGISYCATCDGKYYQDKEVIVVGGGNSAIEETFFILKFAKKVTIVHQFAELQANRSAAEKALANEKIEFIWEHEPRRFEKTETGMDVTIEDLNTKELKTVSCAGVFIFAGMEANLGDFGDQLEMDQWGYIKVDSTMHTSQKDVFAIGDVATKVYRQITVAAAEGTVAAITVSKELEEV
ncbi:MAG: FAD-dependent oxidoreductase [bacterium]|nr:FAD-dependent oxidoreductase [bacterium]